MASNVELQQDDIALADRMNNGRKEILAELHKRIIGQHHVMELVLQTLFVGGNSLIIGVPGLAKTLLIQTLAQVLDLKFKRIQLTPDLEMNEFRRSEMVYEKEDLLISGPGKYPGYSFYEVAGVAVGVKGKGESPTEREPVDVKGLLP